MAGRVSGRRDDFEVAEHAFTVLDPPERIDGTWGRFAENPAYEGRIR